VGIVALVRAIFDSIYRDNAWNGVESRSGPGSGDAATALLRAEIVNLARELDVRTVVDAACGDGYWMPDLPGYTGIDVSAEAIRLAQARHPERRYLVGSLSTVRIPMADLVIFRDALQHLSLRDGMDALARIIGSGPRFLLASTYIGGTNEDIETGDAYSPDLMAAPFRLGEPERLIFDGYHYHEHGTDAVRDPRKHLGLWRIADVT
jgi:SAM-dependent methyltransferase